MLIVPKVVAFSFGFIVLLMSKYMLVDFSVSHDKNLRTQYFFSWKYYKIFKYYNKNKCVKQLLRRLQEEED